MYKSYDAIKSRLLSLYHKYEVLYIKERMSKSPDNCSHNYEHTYHPLNSVDEYIENKISPRKSNTLIVLNTPGKTKICTHGSVGPDADTWNGEICDTVAHAQQCPYFKAWITEEELRSEFRELMLDDEFVFANYKDIVAFQWILNQRISDLLLTKNQSPGALIVPGSPLPWYSLVLSAFLKLFRKFR